MLDISDKVKLATDLGDDLESVNFNSSKMKFFFFLSHHREPFLLSINMANAKLQEGNSLLSWFHIFQWHDMELYWINF